MLPINKLKITYDETNKNYTLVKGKMSFESECRVNNVCGAVEEQALHALHEVEHLIKQNLWDSVYGELHSKIAELGLLSIKHIRDLATYNKIHGMAGELCNMLKMPLDNIEQQENNYDN